MLAGAPPVVAATLMTRSPRVVRETGIAIDSFSARARLCPTGTPGVVTGWSVAPLVGGVGVGGGPPSTGDPAGGAAPPSPLPPGVAGAAVRTRTVVGSGDTRGTGVPVAVGVKVGGGVRVGDGVEEGVGGAGVAVRVDVGDGDGLGVGVDRKGRAPHPESSSTNAIPPSCVARPSCVTPVLFSLRTVATTRTLSMRPLCPRVSRRGHQRLRHAL